MKWTLIIFFAARLWACTVVEGDRILGAHLAAEARAFAALAPDVDLGPAPVAGARRELRPADLVRLAERHAVELGVELAEGESGRACFERATESLREDKLLPVLEAALGENAAVEIVEFSRNPLPLGRLEFTRAGLASSGLWRGRLLYGENRSIPVWARVRVVNLATGEPIAEWRPRTAPEVERGDTVLVEVASGGVVIAFETVAESSGHRGEGVMVRNPANGKRFRAVVEDQGKVVIHP